MAQLRDLFVTSVRADEPINANTTDVPSDQQRPAPAFITLASLGTFPGSAIFVTVVWKFFDRIFGIDHRAVPVVAAFVVAAILYGVSLRSLNSTGEKLAGVAIATANGMYLSLSVLGIDIGLGEAGIIDQTGGQTG